MQKINVGNQKGGVKYEIRYTGDLVVQKFPKRELQKVLPEFFYSWKILPGSQLSAFFEIHMKTVCHVYTLIINTMM